MDYTNYIKPELLVLVPVLVFVGYCLKLAEPVKDKMIPGLLSGIGVVLAAIYVLASTSIATPQDAASAVFTAIVQGVLCAAGAVFADQVVKQGRKDE